MQEAPLENRPIQLFIRMSGALRVGELYIGESFVGFRFYTRWNMNLEHVSQTWAMLAEVG
jgi:hypothetical protein